MHHCRGLWRLVLAAVLLGGCADSRADVPGALEADMAPSSAGAAAMAPNDSDRDKDRDQARAEGSTTAGSGPGTPAISGHGGAPDGTDDPEGNAPSGQQIPQPTETSTDVPDQPAADDPGESGAQDTVGLRPELLDVWYFAWDGDNLSLFQIGLCEDGTAVYAFAEAPNAQPTVVLQAPYSVISPTQLTVEFPDTGAATRSSLSFELAYDAQSDRISRTQATDGYDSLGYRQRTFPVSQAPLATCPD